MNQLSNIKEACIKLKQESHYMRLNITQIFLVPT